MEKYISFQLPIKAFEDKEFLNKMIEFYIDSLHERLSKEGLKPEINKDDIFHRFAYKRAVIYIIYTESPLKTI